MKSSLTLLIAVSYLLVSTEAQCPEDDPFDDSCDILNGLMVEQALPNMNAQLKSSVADEIDFSTKHFLMGEFGSGKCAGQSATVEFSFYRITGLQGTAIESMTPSSLQDASCRGFYLRPDCEFDISYDPIQFAAETYTLWADVKVHTPSLACASSGGAMMTVTNPQFSTTAQYQGEVTSEALMIDSVLYNDGTSQFPAEIGGLELEIGVYDLGPMGAASLSIPIQIYINTTAMNDWVQKIMENEVSPLLVQAMSYSGLKQPKTSVLTVELDRNTAISARRQIYLNHFGTVLTFDSMAARVASPFVFLWCLVADCDSEEGDEEGGDGEIGVFDGLDFLN